ncbi:MAG: primosomal protein N', partial [Armatimonadota bacterium]
TLTPHQQRALSTIQPAIRAGRYEAFLLYGVTGSGKTEVYLRASAETLRTGRTVLFLVPEIALTVQLTQAFRERFGEAV